jgi:hypothetical protein
MAFPPMMSMIGLTSTTSDIPALVKKADELLSPYGLVNQKDLVGTNVRLTPGNVLLTIADNWTNSGSSFRRQPSRFAASAAIEELRKLTDLPLTTIAGMLGVERRSVYFWIEGRPISPDNQTRLEALQSMARRFDQGEPSQTAGVLLAAYQAPEASPVTPDRLAGLRAIEGRPGARLPQFPVAALIQRGPDSLPSSDR